MTIRAVAFDLDGTLVPGTSTCEYLGERMGHGAQMKRLEDAYHAGTITNAEVAEWDGPYFAGRTRAEVYRLLADAPVIGGIRETVAALKAAGIQVVIATIAWKFVAEYYVETYGFAAGSGCEMGEEPPGILTGKMTRYFEAADKVTFVRDFCEEHGIGLHEVAAVGDSRSDIPLFKAVGLPIAFNAWPEAVAAAAIQVKSDDLRDILTHLRGIGNRA